EFLRRVRAAAPANAQRIAAIALTAFARTEDRTRALMAGYHIHVAKPVEPDHLIETIKTLVNGNNFSSHE
ncbi:MAG: response regulator, partial [Acidobacteriota bacterium]